MSLPRQSSLQELAKALPQRERSILLDKIRKSLSVQQLATEQTVYKRIEDVNQRAQMLNAEYIQLGLWDKFVLWLQNLFTSAPREELVLKRIMSQGIRKLSKAPYEIIESDGEIVTGKFAEAVLELYRSIIVSAQVVRFFWDQPRRLQAAVEHSLTQRIPDSKTSLFRFRPFLDLVQDFVEKESKAEIKSAVIGELRRYLGSIPDEVFSELETGILPLYWLRDLCYFDFGKLFSLFRVTLEEISPEEPPSFKAAAVGQLTNLLDSFTYALYNAGKLASSEQGLHKEILAYFRVLHSDQEIRIEESSAKEQSHLVDKETLAEISEEDLEDLNAAFRKLPDAIRSFSAKVPIANLLKVCHRDPFYKFIAYSPSLRIREFYASALELRVLEELDEQFMPIRQEVVSRYIQSIFPTGMRPLQYFVSEVVQVKISGAPMFANVEAINCLHAFLKHLFVPEHAEPLRNISRMVPERLREVHNAFQFQTAALEDTLMLIERLDELFNPLSEDGKVFFRTRASAMRDLNQQKAYRSLILQRDREVKELIDRGIEGIDAIALAIEELQSTTIESVREEVSKMTESTSGRPVKDLLKSFSKKYQILKKTILLQEALGEELNQLGSREVKRI